MTRTWQSPDDLRPVLEALYALPSWLTGASIAIPDWLEGDPRWQLVDELDRYTTASKALDVVRDAIEDERRACVRRYAERDVPRPMIAHALGMSLSELREWMGWP